MATVEQRFWSKVDKRNVDECWNWIGSKTLQGYGQLFLKAKKPLKKTDRNIVGRAPRISWELHHGKIKKGLFVLHKCDNPSCVNPKHLFLGNHKANMKDCLQKGRTARGVRLPQTKLNSQEVLMVRKLYKQKSITQRLLGKLFGVGQDQISRIINFRRRVTL